MKQKNFVNVSHTLIIILHILSLSLSRHHRHKKKSNEKKRKNFTKRDMIKKILDKDREMNASINQSIIQSFVLLLSVDHHRKKNSRNQSETLKKKI